MKMDVSKIGKEVKEVVKIANSLTTKKIRVAVLGAKFAGKTVLLSAIDRYLQELEDDGRFVKTCVI